METYKCLSSRRSVRHYTPKQITKKNLIHLIKAASLAPSGGNAQPWYFYIITNPTIIQKMRNIIIKSSPDPKSIFFQKFGTLFNAQHVISVCLDMNKRWYHKNNPSNIKSVDDVFDNPDYFSVAAAIQNILLAAHDLNIGTCWCKTSSIYRHKLEKFLGIKHPWRLVANITLGYYPKKPIKPPRKPIEAIHKFID